MTQIVVTALCIYLVARQCCAKLNTCSATTQMTLGGEEKPPSIILRKWDWQELVSGSGKVEFDGETGIKIRVECTAPYPMELIYNANELEKGTLAYSRAGWYTHAYTNFTDPSTYIFYSIQELEFGPNLRTNQTFLCQSVINTCLQQVLLYTFYVKTTKNPVNFQLLPGTTAGGNEFVDKEAYSSSTNCSAQFYYELPSKQMPAQNLAYQLRCEFPDGRPGRIKQFVCAHKVGCHRIFRHREKQVGCWNQFNSMAGRCATCKAFGAVPNYIASVVTCMPEKEEEDLNQQMVGRTGSSSLKEFGTLVFYGVPKDSVPKIFFDDETAQMEPNEMIYMDEFPVEQPLNSTLDINCLASGYYAAASMQFALQYTNDQLHFLNVSRNLLWNDPFSARQQKMSIHLKNEKLTRIYCFAPNENSYQWINTSRPIRVEGVKMSESTTSTVVSPVIIALIVGSIVLIFVLILALLVRHIKRLKRQLRDLTEEEVHDFVYGNGNLEPNDVMASINSRPFDRTLEIPRDQIELDEKCVLGSGQFGVVLKGWLKNNFTPTAATVLVAVKKVKPNVDVENFKALLSEIKIMSYLGHHENIVLLIGASTANIKEQVSPYVNENAVSTLQLVKFAQGIANGMNHLTAKDVIHADLAARNVLLTQDLRVKVSDFGLSRQLINCSNYVKQQKVPLPWKWMSVESLRDMEFSIKSDVWSYGVVLWEIFSLGENPFPGCAWTHEFLNQIFEGYRMKRPSYANEKLYDLMVACWHLHKSERPTFELILTHVMEIMEELVSSFDI